MGAPAWDSNDWRIFNEDSLTSILWLKSANEHSILLPCTLFVNGRALHSHIGRKMQTEDSQICVHVKLLKKPLSHVQMCISKAKMNIDAINAGITCRVKAKWLFTLNTVYKIWSLVKHYLHYGILQSTIHRTLSMCSIIIYSMCRFYRMAICEMHCHSLRPHPLRTVWNEQMCTLYIVYTSEKDKALKQL